MAFHHASTEETHELAPNVSRRYAWVVFALTFGLLISDYMSRQVLNAVFPMLKAEWGLSDSQLGGLSGVVALMVGLLTFPLSLMADRWGRVRSLALMAALWSLATLACGISQNFNQMFLARFFVGVGEAAYGSVGIAVVLSVFPSHMRASLIGAFMAGGMLGSVLGMASGGILATHFGWRGSFVGIAVFGLLLSIIYPLVVKQKRIDAKSVSGMEEQSAPAASTSQRPTLASLYSTRSVIAIYFGSGLQLFVTSALIAWMPSFLNRYYSMSPDRAGVMAAGFVLSIGIGMVICGMLCDRLCRHAPERKMALAIAFCLSCCVLLSIAFNLPNGNAQLLLIVIGMFFAAGTGGPAGAMVANLTHAAIHGTAFATLTLANSLLGLAPGPFVTGVLADMLELDNALKLVPLFSIASTLAFLYAKRHYVNDIAKVRVMRPTNLPAAA